MAEPLKYQPRAADVPLFSTADQELRMLIERLHERGVLRLLNNLLGRFPQVGEQLVDAVYRPSGGNAIQNLTAVIELLGHIPPEDMRRFSHAVQRAAARTIESVATDHADPPGVRGVWALLHDDELWRTIRPLVEGSKVFAAELRTGQDRGPDPVPGPSARPTPARRAR